MLLEPYVTKINKNNRYYSADCIINNKPVSLGSYPYPEQAELANWLVNRLSGRSVPDLDNIDKNDYDVVRPKVVSALTTCVPCGLITENLRELVTYFPGDNYVSF